MDGRADGAAGGEWKRRRNFGVWMDSRTKHSGLHERTSGASRDERKCGHKVDASAQTYLCTDQCKSCRAVTRSLGACKKDGLACKS